MEMRRIFKTIVVLAIYCCLLPLLSSAQMKAAGKALDIMKYEIRDGEMKIIVSKNISKEAIDSFKKRYNLEDLDLFHFVKTNSFDSLNKLGWNLEISNVDFFVITKPLVSSKDIGNPADKIVMTQQHPEFTARFPVQSENVSFGCNQFLHGKFPFAIHESNVTFYLKNYLKAKKVALAGSFDDWNPQSIYMELTDSGWIVNVQLTQPGKYWYKFIVDGNWIIDPDNNIAENDGEGNTNSVYYLPNYTFKLDSFATATKAFLTGNFISGKLSNFSMFRTKKGWALDVYISDGTYSYKFVVDGTSYLDPKNPKKISDNRNDYYSVLALGDPYLFKLKGYLDAKQVFLSGNFNDWRPDQLPMKKMATDWELPYILRAGNYQYKFVVDGNWFTDPDNPIQIDNDRGTKNSFLVIKPNYTFVLKGFGNAKTVYLAGDFNDWNPNSLLMKHEGDQWTFSVHLSPGKHKYKFVVDGQWITDPGNKLFEENDNNDSVIWVSK